MTTLSKKILVVDDEEPIREIMEINLVRLGYDTKLAKNAKEALEILENEKFSLIITDLKMPEMDGIELCLRIKERTSNTLIYAFSGGFTEVDSDKLEKMGFDGLLCKPVKFEMLERAIEGAFKKIDERKGKVVNSPF